MTVCLSLRLSVFLCARKLNLEHVAGIKDLLKLFLKNRTNLPIYFYIYFLNPPEWHRYEIRIRVGGFHEKYANTTPKNKFIALGNIFWLFSQAISLRWWSDFEPLQCHYWCHYFIQTILKGPTKLLEVSFNFEVKIETTIHLTSWFLQIKEFWLLCKFWFYIFQDSDFWLVWKFSLWSKNYENTVIIILTFPKITNSNFERNFEL